MGIAKTKKLMLAHMNEHGCMAKEVFQKDTGTSINSYNKAIFELRRTFVITSTQHATPRGGYSAIHSIGTPDPEKLKAYAKRLDQATALRGHGVDQHMVAFLSRGIGLIA